LEGEPLIDVMTLLTQITHLTSTFWHTTLKLFRHLTSAQIYDGDSTLFRSFLRVSAAHGTGGDKD